MEIQHFEDGHKGKFFVKEHGNELAAMTYEWAGKDRFIIDHTEVSEQLAGQGVGKKLVMKAVEMARYKQVKIDPLCPFANKVLRNKDEYLDIL